MAAVVDFVSDVVEGAVDAVGDIVETVGDVVEDVGDAISDAGSWIDDNVLQPMADDPFKTVVTIAAVATGNAYMIPYINAADVAMKGGDLEDIGKAYVISSVAQGAGQYVAAEAASMAAATEYGVSAGSQQAAMLAAQEAGMNTAIDLAASTGGGAGGAAAAAALSGGDPITAAIMGGTSGAIGGGTRYVAEDVLGTDIATSTAGKIGTKVASEAIKANVMPEVYSAITDTPDRPAPTQTAAYTGSGTGTGPGTSTGTAGNYEMKKYINDEGGVMYISFRNGEPQQVIPPGYREEKAGEFKIPETTGTLMAAKGGLASKKAKPVVKSNKGLAKRKK